MEASLIGSKGSGKTSLLRLLCFLEGVTFPQGDKKLVTFTLRDEDALLLQREHNAEKVTLPKVEMLDYPNVGLEPLEVLPAHRDQLLVNDVLLWVLRGNDFESVELLLLDTLRRFVEADIEVLQRSLEGKWVKREPEKGEKVRTYKELLLELRKVLEKWEGLSALGGSPLEYPKEDLTPLSAYRLLTLKRITVVLNVSYEEMNSENLRENLSGLREALGGVLRSLSDLFKPGGKPWISPDVVVGDFRLERELRELEPEDRELFMTEYGLERFLLPDDLLKLLVRNSGYIRFFTAGPKEVREHLVPEGTTILEAAGKIHTDMMKGFVRGEVYNVSDVKEVGLREAERIRKRKVDRSYLVQDGDILHILFTR